MNACSVLRRGIAAAALCLLPGTALPAAEPSAAQVHATLQAAEAVRAVKRLQHAYAFYLNEGLWGDAADLFTGNAAAQFGGEAVSGRDALRRHLMQQAGRRHNGLAPGQLHTHLIMQPVITLGPDGRSARGTWHEMQMLGHFGRSAGWTGGVYENEYRLDGGVWKISRLHYYPQYAGGFDDYGHKAPAKWGIPYHFDAQHVGVAVPPSALAALAAAAPPVDAVRLQRRAALLRDETEVRNLQHAFGYYLDRKLWDDVVDLFARGGSLELGARGAYVGRERIRKALETFHGPAPLRRGELFDHILLGTVVTIAADGQRAAARSTELGQIGLNGQYARWEVGTYENQFIREDGKWKIAAVRHFPRLVTDYDLGWARDAQPAPGISQEFPPDRRPAQRFASYPARQAVAPHFVNPVTGRRAGSPGGAVTAVPVVHAPEFPDRRTLHEAIAVSGPQVDLLALERQARIAIGVDATENLMSSYGYYIDESAWDEMADTYASTGAKEVTGAGVYVGPERIRRILKLRGPLGGRTASFFTIHQLTQPVIHVADDGLSAKARVRLFQAGGNADGSSGSWIGGIYENTALVEHGQWKFGIQDLHHVFNASYRNGWARVGPGVTSLPGRPPSPRDQRGGGITQGLGGARAGPRLADEMPPDRAIRARQYAFPDISEPAFHYVNPVSGRRPAELLP